jgi:two-component system cell cycle response regulator DivK
VSQILVVEDNEANQMLTRAVLELDGHEVRVAGSAPEAVELIRERAPELILMDLQLPGQDGLSFTRDLKSDAATAAITVVALTAHAMSGDDLFPGVQGLLRLHRAGRQPGCGARVQR